MENMEVMIGNENCNFNPKYVEVFLEEKYFIKKEYQGLKCAPFLSQPQQDAFSWDQEDNQHNYAILKVPLLKDKKLYQYAYVPLIKYQGYAKVAENKPVKFMAVPPAGRLEYKNP